MATQARRAAYFFAVVLLAVACRGTTGRTGEGPTPAKETAPANSSVPVCESDAECVMSCVAETDCCVNPCGCDTVRHRETHDAVVAANKKYCADPKHECNVDVGACDPSYVYATPRCVAGKCAAEVPPRG